MIAFIGSVFSPYYALARRRAPGRADPANHCTVNVALYGSRAARWSMTERSRRALAVSHDTLAIGPSTLRWDGQTLDVDFDEIAMPVPRRLRGSLRVSPVALQPQPFVLNPEGEHLWHPMAPRARVTLTCDHPALSWSGSGYFDHNRGSASLEQGFRAWHWSRGTDGDETAIFYDGHRRDGVPFGHALRITANGDAEPIAQAPAQSLTSTRLWRVPRQVRSDGPAVVVRTMEDAPFYARSALRMQALGKAMEGVGESLSLDRFKSPIVQAMLPFRMPRRAG